MINASQWPLFLDFMETKFAGSSSMSFTDGESSVELSPTTNKDAKKGKVSRLLTACLGWHWEFPRLLTGKELKSKEHNTRTPLNAPSDTDLNELGGYLWKLDPRHCQNPSEMVRIESWRRRFFMCPPQGKRGPSRLVYVSERRGAEAVNMGSAVSLEELPPIELEPMSVETRCWVRTSIEAYDIAMVMTGIRGHIPEALYDQQVPRRLYPFLLTVRDRHGVHSDLVVASRDEHSYRRWMSRIQCPRGAQADADN